MSGAPKDSARNHTRERLFGRLASLGITTEVVPYPEHTSVEEGKALRGQMAGTFTKNLLRKDKKRQIFLLAIHEDRELNLKTLSGFMGGKGHLSFVRGEQMEQLLGVAPGALTPMGLINDADAVVTAVIDAALMDAAQLNFHPLVQTESMGISPADLLRFIRSCGREPVVADLDAAADQATGS